MPTLRILGITLTCIWLPTPCFALGGEPPSTLSSVSQPFKVSDLPNRDTRGGLALTMDDSGNLVVVWGVRQGDTGFDLFGKRFDRDGKELTPPSVQQETNRGNEFQINHYTAGNQGNPGVGVDGEGNFVVVWQSSGQDGSGRGIFAKRYDARGGELAPPPGLKGKRLRQRAPDQPGDSSGPGMAICVDVLPGRFRRGRAGPGLSQEPRGNQRHPGPTARPEGRRIGEEFRVTPSSARAIARIALASAPDGSLLIAWADQFRQRHVWARRYEGGGDRLGVSRGPKEGNRVFRLSSYNGEHFTTAQGAVVEATGGFLVAFGSLQDEDGFGVFAKRFDAEGNEIPPVPELVGAGVENEFQVNSYSHSSQGLGGVASDGERSVIVWASREQDGDHLGVFAKAYDAAGREIPPPAVLRGKGVGSEFQINTSTKGLQAGPRIAMNGDGDFAIAWFGATEGDGRGVFARRFTLQ